MAPFLSLKTVSGTTPPCPPFSPSPGRRSQHARGALQRVNGTETKLKIKFMALFQTNILKLTETANQTQSPKLQEKLNGHLQETTLRQGGRGVCPVPAGWMKTVARVSMATELRCRC